MIVYGKPDCSLCSKATAIVERLRGEFGYEIAHIDVTRDPASFSRYHDQIPVVVLDGEELARGIVSIPPLRAALRRSYRKGRVCFPSFWDGLARRVRDWRAPRAPAGSRLTSNNVDRVSRLFRRGAVGSSGVRLAGEAKGPTIAGEHDV